MFTFPREASCKDKFRVGLPRALYGVGIWGTFGEMGLLLAGTQPKPLHLTFVYQREPLAQRIHSPHRQVTPVM